MSNEEITSYKGFNNNLQCRGFQFEVGKSYTHEGEVKACNGGFHACEHPMDIFCYYAPPDSRFGEVKQSGELSRHEEDSKVASQHLTVCAEIGIPGLITAAIKYVTSKCDPVETKHSTGDSSASSATGYMSASSATGDSSASSATGNRSASSATGYMSASSATGDSSASSATGYRSASSATGDSSASSATGYMSASSATGDSSASLSTGLASSSEIKPDDKPQHAVAIAAGGESKARAPMGSAIVCVYRNDDGELLHIRASKIGENGIKPDTWYTLNADGEFVEV